MKRIDDFTKQDIDKLRELYLDQKQSTRFCAEYFGVSQPTIRKIIKLNRFPVRGIDQNHGIKGAIRSEEACRKASESLKKRYEDRYIEMVCDYCKQIFKRLKGRIRGIEHNFCGSECRNEFFKVNIAPFNTEENLEKRKINSKPKIIKIERKVEECLSILKLPRNTLVCVSCDECGVDVFRKPSEIKENKNIFCSKECAYSWLSKNKRGDKIYNYNSVLVKCTECNKEFLRQPNQVERAKNSFCSKECSKIWLAKRKQQRLLEIEKEKQNKVLSKGRQTRQIYNQITKEQLSDLYYNQKMDKTEMCIYFNLGKQAMSNLLIKYGIPSNINPKTEMCYNFKGEILKCSICEKEFSRPKSHLNDNGMNFCSKKCLGKYKSIIHSGENHPNYKKEEFPCPVCGKITLMAPSQVKNGRKFCSREHEGLWRSKNSSGEKSCHWKGGYIDDYGWSWPRARRLARKRDNYTCQRCGITEEELIKLNEQKIQVHHLTPYRLFGLEHHEKANKLDNLLCLCPKDHKMYEMEISEIIDAMGEEYAKVLYVYN